MRNIFLLLMLTLVMDSSLSTAATKKVKSLDGTSEASADAPTYGQGPLSSSAAALSLARSASEGAGRLSRSGAYCYRAVKQIIADAFGKDLQCVRGILSNGSAKNAGPDLLRFGFVLDNSKCDEPGTVRVYKGVRTRRKASAGDIHGHVEVVGEERMYHSFYSSPEAINQTMPGRRILTGCYVADNAKFKSGPGGDCPPAKNSLKTKGSSGTKNLRKRMGVE